MFPVYANLLLKGSGGSMRIKIFLFLLALCIHAQFVTAQSIPSPWAGKTAQEIEEIIDSVSLNLPRAI